MRSISDLLGPETEKIGVVPKLFYKIMKDLNLKPSQFNWAVKKFLDDPRNGFYNDPKKKSFQRSNLMKEIRRPTMTIKVLLKLIRVLSPLDARIEIHMRWKRGWTIHGIDLHKISSVTYEDYEPTEAELQSEIEDEDVVQIEGLKLAKLKLPSYTSPQYGFGFGDEEDDREEESNDDFE